jgi:capsular polysaccharide biosynthesis protein
MNETFDAYRYIGYLRSHWRWIAGSAALAVGLAAAASLAMTPQYTATARLVIDPPAGADLRAAMAVSPIYLESLKTYEHLAASDSLFQKRHTVRARRTSDQSAQAARAQVQLVRNTRILEISPRRTREGAGPGHVSGGGHRRGQPAVRFRATGTCCTASTSRPANCARD